MPRKSPLQRVQKPADDRTEKQSEGVSPIPHFGWLRDTRLKLGRSQVEVAERIGIKRQAYANFETGEVRSTISLASLRRAADAMDCDLIYALVPKAGATSPTSLSTVPSVPAVTKGQNAANHFIAQTERSAEELPLQLL